MSKPPYPSRVDEVLARLMPPVEWRLGRIVGPVVGSWATEFLVFGIKQAWACLFGGLVLAAIIVTAVTYPPGAPLARYDALFLYAFGVQGLFLATHLERPREALVILVFHLAGTAMELFKTGAG